MSTSGSKLRVVRAQLTASIHVNGRSTFLLQLPLRTGCGQNDRLHHFARARKVKAQREAVHLLWPWQWREHTWRFPVLVHLVRISPANGKQLDDDNLRGSLKAVRDQVAAELGVDDGDRSRIRFEYSNERGAWGVRLQLLEDTP